MPNKLYIANDMMFFTILPFVILLYCRNKLAGYSMTVLLILANIITVFTLSEKNHHSMAKVKDTNNREIYHMPYSRFGAYFVGCLFGMFYYEWKQSKTNPNYQRSPGAFLYGSIESSRILRIFLHFLGAGIILFLVMITYTETRVLDKIIWPQMASNFFNALHRPIFVIGLALFLSGPMVGGSKFVRFILGGSAWAPWAKITFMVYLVHDIVLTWYYTQTRQALYITKRVAIYYWFAALILSFLLSIPAALIIESPILQLEKLLLFPPKSSKGHFHKPPEAENQRLYDTEVNSDTIETPSAS